MPLPRMRQRVCRCAAPSAGGRTCPSTRCPWIATKRRDRFLCPAVDGHFSLAGDDPSATKISWNGRPKLPSSHRGQVHRQGAVLRTAAADVPNHFSCATVIPEHICRGFGVILVMRWFPSFCRKHLNLASGNIVQMKVRSAYASVKSALGWR